VKTPLDDKQTYLAYDGDNMLAHLHDVAELCRRAWRLAEAFQLPTDYREINKIVILGMGGSAIGGDLLSSLVATECPVPIMVNRGYELPAYVDGRTLLIASSYSGATEETTSAFRTALKTDAKKLVFTTGGPLKELAQNHKIPAFVFDYQSQPRAALPYSLIPLLAILQKLALVADKSRAVAAAAAALDKLDAALGENIPEEHNPAKKLAQKLAGRLPVIYGAGLFGEVAHRWKTQLNENSKAWAFHEVFPELNHNAVVGYQFPPEITRSVTVVILRPASLHPRVALRCDITMELLRQAGVRYELAGGEPGDPLTQMLTAVLLGDYVSYYLALLHRVAVTPVEAISYLKDRLQAQN